MVTTRDALSGRWFRLSGRPVAGAVSSVVILVHVLLVGWGAFRHSPTVDEPAYLAAGISHWEFGRFDLCKISPPLVRLVAAVPLQLSGHQTDWSRYYTTPGMRFENLVGRDFVVANGSRAFWLFTLARLACIPFSLIGACVSYFWARELFGGHASIAAVVLWCFSPNILAHAQLSTPDIGVSALCLATCYAFWKWSGTCTWAAAVRAGVVLGMAVLAKTNALALYPALALAVPLQAVYRRRTATARVVIQLVTGFAISVYVINLGYGFEGSLRRLGDYTFISRTLTATQDANRFRGTFVESLPVPFPSAFIEGIDQQRKDFENSNGWSKTYLRGQWYDHGWWWYYFYVLGVKVPIGTWILLAVSSSAMMLQKTSCVVESFCYLVIPGSMLFALACSQTGFSHSLRYVLPAFPFAFVVASGAVSWAASRWQRAVSVAALSCTVMSSLYVFPHSLSYYNEVAGGPRNGHFHLLDGNTEWSQDLRYVADWVDKHPTATPLYVAYWGFLPLENLGLDWARPDLRVDDAIPPGWYIISVNFLRGEFRMRRPELERFLSVAPEDYIAYTAHVYRVE